MARPRTFLVVDDNPDSRFLLVKTLLRKYPHAVMHETQDAEKAVATARAGDLDALVVHRAEDVDGLTLVRRLRETSPTVPLVMVSGIDRSREAVAAGANAFLSYDAWLRIGTVVSDLLDAARGKASDEKSETSASANR